MNQVRQGDIFFQKVNKLPTTAKTRITNTVAYGEVSGHSHRFDTKTMVTYEDDKDVFVSLEEPTTLVHEEHGPIVFDVGVYKVVHQREYSPKENRRVLD